MRSTFHKYKSGYQSLNDAETTPLNPRTDRPHRTFPTPLPQAIDTDHAAMLSGLRQQRHHQAPRIPMPRHMVDQHTPRTNRWYPQTQEITVFTPKPILQTEPQNTPIVNNFGQWSYQGPAAHAPMSRGPLAPDQGGMMYYQWQGNTAAMDPRMIDSRMCGGYCPLSSGQAVDPRMMYYNNPCQYYYQQMLLTNNGYNEQGTVIGNPVVEDLVNGSHGNQGEARCSISDLRTESTFYNVSKPYKKQRSKRDKMTSTDLVLGSKRRQKSEVMMRSERLSNNMAPGAERGVKKPLIDLTNLPIEVKILSTVLRKPEVPMITITPATPVTKSTPVAMTTPTVTTTNTITILKTSSTLNKPTIIYNPKDLSQGPVYGPHPRPTAMIGPLTRPTTLRTVPTGPNSVKISSIMMTGVFDQLTSPDWDKIYDTPEPTISAFDQLNSPDWDKVFDTPGRPGKFDFDELDSPDWDRIFDTPSPNSPQPFFRNLFETPSPCEAAPSTLTLAQAYEQEAEPTPVTPMTGNLFDTPSPMDTKDIPLSLTTSTLTGNLFDTPSPATPMNIKNIPASLTTSTLTGDLFDSPSSATPGSSPGTPGSYGFDW